MMRCSKYQPFFLLFFTLFYFVPLDAQLNEQKADEIVDGVKSRYLSNALLSMDFRISFDYPDMDPIHHNGQFWAQEDMFKLYTDEQHIFSDGLLTWKYDIADSIVYINSYNGQNESLSPTSIMSLLDSDDYDYAVINSGKIDKSQVYSIVVKPLVRDSEFAKARITVDEGYKLRRMEMFFKDGASVIIESQNEAFSPTTPMTFFQFPKSEYPQARVEDLRW